MAAQRGSRGPARGSGWRTYVVFLAFAVATALLVASPLGHGEPAIADDVGTTQAPAARSDDDDDDHHHPRQRGFIIVHKRTEPSGSRQVFRFDTDYHPGEFKLRDGHSKHSGALVPGTYRVREVVPPGWRLASATCSDGSDPASIGVSAGETVVCHFVNVAEPPGRIIVRKHADPAGSQAFTFDASWGSGSFSLAHGQEHRSGDLAPGSYSVTERVPEGWKLTGQGCDDDSHPSSIGLSPGEIVTCTFENTKLGRILVRKDAGADSPQAFTFDADWGPGTFSLTHDGEHNSGLLDPGTYRVTERVPDGWELTGQRCDDGSHPSSIALSAGETVTCTFTNRPPTRIVVVKQAPDDPGQGFRFTGALTATLRHTQSESRSVDPGEYRVTETVPTGWHQPTIRCDDDDSSGADATATFRVRHGETVTCTFTNRPNGSRIVVVKQAPDDPDQGFRFTGALTATLRHTQSESRSVDPGEYRVTETVPTGWHQPTIRCDDDDSSGADATATFRVRRGETVTCTFTNRPTHGGTIVVLKDADPNSSQDFPFTTSGGLSPAGFSLDDDNDDPLPNRRTFHGLSPGDYSVTEGAVDGWRLTGLACVDSNPSGRASSTADATATIRLDRGETVTCTFTNEPSLGTIVVVKDAVPPNSTQDFPFTTSGGLSPAGFSLVDDNDPTTLPNRHTFSGLEPGDYSVTEGAVDGWRLTGLACVDSNPSGRASTTADATATIRLDPRETVTCTFTNAPVGGTVVVSKVTEPIGAAGSFEFTLTGPDASATRTLTRAGTSSFTGLPPGRYTLTETVPGGWRLTGQTCPGQFDLAEGQTISCTFTNTKQGTLTVEKATIPPGDPTRFTIRPSWDDAFDLGDGDARTWSLDPDRYSVAEAVPDGWRQLPRTCSDGSSPAAVDLAPGETVTCRFVNAPIPGGPDGFATITVEKEATPGGASTPFTFDLSGPDASRSVTIVGAGTARFTDLPAPGPYTLSERTSPGWVLAEARCDSGPDPPRAITVAAGEPVTCRFVNVATAPGDAGPPPPPPPPPATIIVQKSVTSAGGEGVEFPFTLVAPTGGTLDDVAGVDDDARFVNLQTSGLYALRESPPTGWVQAPGATCRDEDGNETTDLELIDVRAGSFITCSVENDRPDRARILVEVETTPAASPVTFVFNSSYGAPFALAGGGRHASEPLSAHRYRVDASPPRGWDELPVACTPGPFHPNAIDLGGDDVTCVFRFAAQVDVALGLEVPGRELNVGDTATVTVTASNLGIREAPDVSVDLTFPAGVTPSAREWAVGTLAPGATQRLPVEVAIDAEMFGDVVAALAAAVPGDVDDTNDTARAFLHAGAAGVTGGTFDDADGDGERGDEEESWPAGLPIRLVDQATGDGWDAVVGPDGRFEFSGLPGGEYELRLDLPRGVRTADVLTFALEPGERKQVDVPLWRSVDVGVSIDAPRHVGDEIVVTMTVRNTGDFPARAVRVEPTALPGGFEVLERRGGDGVSGEAWTLDALLAGRSAVLTLRGRLDEPGDLEVAVSSARRDVNPSDNLATVRLERPTDRFAIVGTVVSEQSPHDGAQQPPEGMYVEDVTIKLSGGGEEQTVVPYQGGYRFMGLQPDVLYVVEIIGAPGATPGSVQVTLTEEQPVRHVDFYVPPGEDG